ncbi:hypothetical protein LAZ67_8000195 [Cordylochernes scorpioides]|uniref:Transposase n=1 Tax=Cordylochernes scorpioides TaxID=51811 RepID=A0ABY6KP51_9ARAC|nr:hypothetical protein LAZ67_8000195 [Cordylochernes scorpioides]
MLSAGKVMAIVFWDRKGVLLVDYLHKGETINSERYCETLTKLRRAIQNKRQGRLTKGVVLLHDNANPHVSRQTTAKLEEFGWDIFGHPPYSPDLAPSDYHMFPALKKHLGGQKFASDNEVKEEVDKWLKEAAGEWYNTGITKLVDRMKKVIEHQGDYEGLPCQVYCSASTLGIAGILKQAHPNGKTYPVQYFSRSLRSHERNYSSSELECLAIVESVDKFRIYFMDNVEEEIDRRCAFSEATRRAIIAELQTLFHEHNCLVRDFKSAVENVRADDMKFIIRADKTPTNEHERRFNAPMTPEVAAVIVGTEIARRDIVICRRDGTKQRVAETHRSRRDNEKVSCMDFYAYRIMIRAQESNPILKCRQLFQQFIVDMYAKVESERLNYIHFNQSKLRADQYIHLRDAIANDGAAAAANIGQMVILPASYTGSPRHMHEYAQDAMTYVRTYGLCSLEYKPTLPQVQNPMDIFKETACYRRSPQTRKWASELSGGRTTCPIVADLNPSQSPRWTQTPLPCSQARLQHAYGQATSPWGFALQSQQIRLRYKELKESLGRRFKKKNLHQRDAEPILLLQAEGWREGPRLCRKPTLTRVQDGLRCPLLLVRDRNPFLVVEPHVPLWLTRFSVWNLRAPQPGFILQELTSSILHPSSKFLYTTTNSARTTMPCFEELQPTPGCYTK